MYPGTWAVSHPDRAAIVMASNGEVVTYRELDERSNQLAHHFRRLGLRAGDVIAVLMENNSRYHEVIWAARRAGLYYTPVNNHLTAAEAAYIVADSGARVLIASEGTSELAAQLSEQALPALQHRMLIGGALPGWDDYDDVVRRYPTTALDDETEGDLLQYSAGTTGRPKGIVRALRGGPIDVGSDSTVPFLQSLQFEPGHVYLSPAPLYHTAPISWTMAVHRLGGTVVVMEHFDAERYLALVSTHRVTHSMLVPTMFVRMLKLPEEARARYDVSSLVAAIHAAAPCPVEAKRQMIAWWGPIVYEFWSSSEGAGATFITSEEWLAHPGSVGRARVGTLHILDERGQELGSGQEGEIWCEGGLPLEYLNEPAKTAEAHNRHGWTSVGDVGYLDEEGYLFLTDRKAHMIISGGVNIYPREAEDVLLGHPEVYDVAVIGVPHADMGEEVKAIVQPVSPERAGPELGTELLAYCRERLATYKCPRSVDFDPSLPRLDNGKLYKRVLRDRYALPS